LFSVGNALSARAGLFLCTETFWTFVIGQCPLAPNTEFLLRHDSLVGDTTGGARLVKMRVAHLEHRLNRHLFRHPAVIAQIVFCCEEIPFDLKLICTEIAMTFT
jgi:hypothetical protein